MNGNGSDVGDGNGFNGVWDLYINDYVNMQIEYPAEWDYKSESYNGMVEVIFFEDEYEFQEDIKFAIGFEELEYGMTTEEYINNYKEFFRKFDEDEDEEYFHLIGVSDTVIDGQIAWKAVIKANEGEFLLKNIYYVLDILAEDIEELDDIMREYENKEDFANRITLNDLEKIKKILRENENEVFSEYIFDSINRILNAGRTNFNIKGKILITAHNRNGVILSYSSIEANYDKGLDIVNRMIDTVKFTN